MIRLSDYVIQFLVSKKIHDIFLVSGGGIMYLLDAVGTNKKIQYLATHHEQGAAIAAESYARIKNQISACLVTTGPGGTNAVTGTACAWFDSIPVLFISGQAKRELIADYTKYRNLSPQEVNIVGMVKPITKYATTIMDPNKILYELEKAVYLATEGRPGPVWLDIPLDIQGTMIDENKLHPYIAPKRKENKNLKKNVKRVIELIKGSRRPLLILGNGVRLSHAIDLLDTFLKRIQAPIILPFNGLDLVPENYKYMVGRFGPGGQRRGNFALQNADLILSIGASLNVSSIGFDYKRVAPKAKKIMVNIEQGELHKPTFVPHFPIKADAYKFIEEFISQSKKTEFTISKEWTDACSMWKKKYPAIIPDFYKDTKHVNSYVFMDVLSDLLKPSDILTTGIGLDAASMYQAFKVKPRQRAFVNKNFGPMGWCLPAAIGACIANNKKPTICVTGDGSFQVNIQELQTIKHNKLPIRIFVFNNGMYESIRATQNNLFDGRFVGSDVSSGVSNTDFKKLANVYNFKYIHIKNNKEIKRKINQALLTKGTVLCEVNISFYQKRSPKASTMRNPDGRLVSRPLEDMAPFLPDAEMRKNMSLFNTTK